MRDNKGFGVVEYIIMLLTLILLGLLFREQIVAVISKLFQMVLSQ